MVDSLQLDGNLVLTVDKDAPKIVSYQDVSEQSFYTNLSSAIGPLRCKHGEAAQLRLAAAHEIPNLMVAAHC